MLSLKKIKFFFYKYNSIINTNYLYFTLPLSYLDVIKFFYKQQIISFYKVSNLSVYIYLPQKSQKRFKKWCNKHQKIYHSTKKINVFSLYWTPLGILYGNNAKKLNSGGRLLYS